MRQALHASVWVALRCAARYSLTALLRAVIFACTSPEPTVAAGVLASLATMRVSLGFFAGVALHAATAASAASGAFRYASRNFASSAMRSLLAAMNASALSPRHAALRLGVFGLLAGVGRPLDGLGLLRLQRLDGGDGVFDGGSLGQAELPQ